MTKTDGERIVILETKMDELTAKLAEVASDVKEIKEKISTESVVHKDFLSRIENLERNALVWRWVVPTLSAVAGSVFTFLLIEYLKRN